MGRCFYRRKQLALHLERFQDIEGLKQLMGGNDEFVAMLDSVFVVPPIFDDSYYGVQFTKFVKCKLPEWEIMHTETNLFST